MGSAFTGKSVVAKYGSQFRGNSQHDALEFLLWLLDRMHEDVSSSPNSHNSKTKASGKLTCRNLDSPVALSKRPFYKHHQCVSRPHCAGQGSSDCTRGWNRRETSGTLRAFKVERGNGLIGFSSVFCLNAPVVRACTTPMSKTGLSAPQRAVSLDVKRGASRERSLVF